MGNLRIQIGSLLAFFALLIGITSFLFSSEVSAGPTIGAFACLLAILGRIIQAGGQHQDYERWHDEDRERRDASTVG